MAIHRRTRDEDDEWLDVLIEGLERGRDGVPGGPSAETQARFVGWSGAEALRECYPFYRLAKESVEQSLPESTILDFGVGWGRLIRFFAREVQASRLHGVDVDPEILEVCRATHVPGDLRLVGPGEPLPYRDSMFDLAYAYSVFSHLSESAARQSLGELGRVLRPGGVLLVTTQGRRFLELCRAVRSKTDRQGFELTVDGWFDDPDGALEAFLKGFHVYTGTGGGGVLSPEFYGWAAVPEAWFRRESPDLEIVTVVDDPAINEQVIFVLRKS